MKLFTKTNKTLLNGFIAGVLISSLYFYFSKHPSYEECILKNIHDAQSDQAARMVNLACKRLKNKPKYVFVN